MCSPPVVEYFVADVAQDFLGRRLCLGGFPVSKSTAVKEQVQGN